MPDAQFADPRLAAIYDDLDADRSDLDHWSDIVRELRARSIVDVGCGTGTFACRLANLGLNVTAVDPALASLDVARRKPGADLVAWVHGTSADLSGLNVDIVTMTGNVAQVFLEDHDWMHTLAQIRNSLRPSGHFVFETRDPRRRGWEEWMFDNTHATVDIAGIGRIESFVELLDVSLPLVSFRWTYRFERDGTVLTSDSTLRFRDVDELRTSLREANFSVREVRDAPDRPGREFVVIAQTVDQFSADQPGCH